MDKISIFNQYIYNINCGLCVCGGVQCEGGGHRTSDSGALYLRSRDTHLQPPVPSR